MRTLIPHRRAVNSPSYMVGMRTGSLVWPAFVHDTTSPDAVLRNAKRQGCALAVH
jgi:hypothetical protein